VLGHHVDHGDFSPWIVGTIQDRELAATVGAVERNLLARRATDLVHAREHLLDEIEARSPTSP
jgi:RNase P protein component